MRTIAYYPGCSLHGTAREYDISVKEVCRELDLELKEVEDWNCCGATSAHSLNQKLAYLLPARNLKIIEESGLDVVIPCAACFSRIHACAYALKNDQDKKLELEQELNFRFKNKTKIYHLSELLLNEVGLDKIRAQIKFSLAGLTFVCYYGCLLVRPHEITGFDDKENPLILDELVQALGAASLDWPYKTECYGASLSLSKPVLVNKLVDKMVSWAREAEADAIITACTLCQANLEMRQTKGNNIPVFYFSEVLGLAFGLKNIEPLFSQHIVDPGSLLDDWRRAKKMNKNINSHV